MCLGARGKATLPTRLNMNRTLLAIFAVFAVFGAANCMVRIPEQVREDTHIKIVM